MKMRSAIFFLSGTVVVVLVGLVAAQKGYTICDVQGCNCTVPAGGWKNVNCNLLDDQELTLQQAHIPIKVTEIFLNGGRSITFSSKTFNSLQALALLRVENTRKVVLQRKAFFNIQSSSLLVQIIGCDDLVFESQAFEEMQGSLSTEIIGTKYVKLEDSPFSKLSNCTFQDVGRLELASNAFKISNIGINGRHGPVTVVLMVNVTLPVIQKETFITSLAQLAFKDCTVGDIQFEAFKSAEIDSISMFNSTFKTIRTGTLTDRTLVVDFHISKCTIEKLQSKAITAGMANLTVNHSTITDIEPKAIVSTAAKVEIIGNQIINFHTTAIVIDKWNKITVDQNVIKNLHADFIVTPINSEIEKFSFKGNEIYNSREGSMSFISRLPRDKLVFDDNFFNESCGCELQEWINWLINTTSHSNIIMDSSFCPVDETLSRCFSLPVGIINMHNFTERACNNNTICEPYKGETRTINTTGRIFIDEDQGAKQKWLIFIIILISVFILALVSTFVALLIRGSRWLKKKGYFRNNYYNNNQSNEEENTIVTIDTENEKLEMPEELTIEFLHELSKRLDDPSTHQEASEMIERLYEMFIVDDSYENNNRDEEAHLYEELGNLNLQIPPPPYEEQAPTIQPTSSTQNTSPRGILKLMEEKFSTTPDKSTLDLSTSSTQPILTGDYSEPLDRDVHLYSELKQRDEAMKGSLRSNGSMSLRPLPEKPGLFEAGPSQL